MRVLHGGRRGEGDQGDQAWIVGAGAGRQVEADPARRGCTERGRLMASVSRRMDRGGKWWARYRDPAGKQHAKMFDRKVDAERWVDSVRGDLSRGTYIDPGAGRQTFGDYARAWQAAQVHRDTTAAQVESHLRNHVL